MSEIILPHSPPQWIYEGNDHRLIEYNSGSVINRASKQLYEDILALKLALENINSTVTYSASIKNVTSDTVIDSINILDCSSVKWYIDISYPRKKLGVLRWIPSELESTRGYFLYRGNGLNVDHNSPRVDIGNVTEVDLDSLGIISTSNYTFFGIAPYDENGIIGDISSSRVDSYMGGKLSFEIYSSHNGSEETAATDIRYTVSSIIRFGTDGYAIPISLVLNTTQAIALSIISVDSVNVRFTRIIIPN